MADHCKTLTAFGGNPVADNPNFVTAGARGPLRTQNYQLMEKLATRTGSTYRTDCARKKFRGAWHKRIIDDVAQYAKI